MASTIILSDNGASSGSAGLKQTAGNDGVLILQTTTSGGTATNAVYVDNNQNSGLGVTPPTTMESAGGLVTGTALGTTSAVYSKRGYLNNSFYDGSNYKYINSTYASQLIHYNGGFYLNSAASGTAGNTVSFTTVASVNKDTTFVLQGGSSSSGTGIAFPATQSASSDANTLDDYEEGTWTPVVGFGSGSTGITYSTSPNGKYTKIGNLVYVQFGFKFSNKGSSTGSMFISGLPFASNNYGSYSEPTGTATYSNFTLTNVVGAGPYVPGGTTTLYFIGQDTSGNEYQLSNIHATNTSFIRGTMIYQVA